MRRDLARVVGTTYQHWPAWVFAPLQITGQRRDGLLWQATNDLLRSHHA